MPNLKNNRRDAAAVCFPQNHGHKTLLTPCWNKTTATHNAMRLPCRTGLETTPGHEFNKTGPMKPHGNL